MSDTPQQERKNTMGDPSGLHERGHPSDNLPLQLTSFVGRGREISEVEALLGDHRLLTLTGTGGSGKTRLALAVASTVAGGFEDGAWLVELASLSDADLVPQAVASVLGVRETAGGALVDSLCAHLELRELLLILDNCEHMIGGCASLAVALLRSCPNLRILATSREALDVAGEIVLAVPPLSLPDPRHLPAPEILPSYAAAKLFYERARAVRPDFHLTEENVLAVAQVCYRLDGMPLAIELAAARMRVLSAEQISARLDDSFRLLAGARSSLARQRTLRATMDWSHELLSGKEKVLFRRFSVFVGGWTLAAAEAVCAGEGIDREEVLDLLASLVDKSLVPVSEQDGEVRYRLLEVVRQYGLEKLEVAGEVETVGKRHARHYVVLAEEAEPELRGTRHGAWLERLETEHGNFRAALRWTLERDEAELALRLAGALGEFWYLSGQVSEGRQWLEEALADREEASEAAQAKALTWAGSMRWIARNHDDYQRLVAQSEEGLALFRRVGGQADIGLALSTLGYAEVQRNELERATALAEEAITLQRASGDAAGVARSIAILGFVALARHDYARATALHEEGQAYAREAGDVFAIVVSLIQGALAYSGRGERERARALCEEGLELARRVKATPLIAGHLHVSAVLATSQDQAIRSARLWGAAEALRETENISLAPIELSYYEPYMAAARSRLGDETWTEAWAEGRKMNPEEAIEYALQKPEPPEEVRSPDTYPADLSAREVEVLRLAAQGMTNAQVAKELYISPRTVNAHMGSVYHKIGTNTRAEAARFASEHGIL